MNIDHVLLTRFNLPSKGPESLIRAQDGWLQRRVELFERYTIPSVAAQTVLVFTGLFTSTRRAPAGCSTASRRTLLIGAYTPIFRDEATWREVGADARQLTGARGELLITTNLDNDDALAVISSRGSSSWQDRARLGRLFLERGLIAFGGRTYHKARPRQRLLQRRRALDRGAAQPLGGTGTSCCATTCR